jgi:hypothetical protein
MKSFWSVNEKKAKINSYSPNYERKKKKKVVKLL